MITKYLLRRPVVKDYPEPQFNRVVGWLDDNQPITADTYEHLESECVPRKIGPSVTDLYNTGELQKMPKLGPPQLNGLQAAHKECQLLDVFDTIAAQQQQAAAQQQQAAAQQQQAAAQQQQAAVD